MTRYGTSDKALQKRQHSSEMTKKVIEEEDEEDKLELEFVGPHGQDLDREY